MHASALCNHLLVLKVGFVTSSLLVKRFAFVILQLTRLSVMQIIIKFNVFSLQHMFSAANKTKQLHFNLFTTNSNQPLVLRCCPGGFSSFVTTFLGSMSFSNIITSPLQRGIDLPRKSSIPLSLLYTSTFNSAYKFASKIVNFHIAHTLTLQSSLYIFG